MGFADYLSRNPTGKPPPPPTDEDKNFVINTINDITFALIKNSLAPNGASVSKADKKQVNYNDVIIPLQKHGERKNASCLKQHRNQSLCLTTNSLSFAYSNLNSFNSKLIAITTQKNPLKETFQIPIKKRFRAPNKKLQMEQSIPSTKLLINLSTQTDYISNKGKGLDAIDESKHEDLFPSYSDTPTPLYRENLNKVSNEEFIAEASSKELKPIIDLVTAQNWEDPKKVNRLYYKIHRDLSITPTNCLIYDNRMVIHRKLKHLVLDAIHYKHPGQVGRLPLAKLVWWPHIHSEMVAKSQACKSYTDKGENLKTLIPKSQLGSLPPLTGTNQEIHMDFAVPIPFKENTQNNYILVTVDRLSRYPHFETFRNCETETDLDYHERSCKQHGIPRSIRCDHAQAFKATEFEIFAKTKT